MADGVIDAKKDFENRNLQAKFERLWYKAKKQERTILEDPMPYLDDLSRRLYNLIRDVEDALYELRGLDLHSLKTETKLVSPNESDFKRNRKAAESLQLALKRAAEPRIKPPRPAPPVPR